MEDINYSNLKIFARLVNNGFITEKQILNMGIGDLIRIPKITAAEIRGINEFKQRIYAGRPLSFLVEESSTELDTTLERGMEKDEA